MWKINLVTLRYTITKEFFGRVAILTKLL